MCTYTNKYLYMYICVILYIYVYIFVQYITIIIKEEGIMNLRGSGGTWEELVW